MHFSTAISALKFLIGELLIPKFPLCAFLRSWRNQSCKKNSQTTIPRQGKPHLLTNGLAKQNKLVWSEATSPSFLKCRVQTNSSRWLALGLGWINNQGQSRGASSQLLTQEPGTLMPSRLSPTAARGTNEGGGRKRSARLYELQ